MLANTVAADEQYRLITECRTSGLTDHQWCLEHGIKPGTFYNWVRRLRKAGACDIPDAARSRKGPRQEVVKVEIAAPVSRVPDGTSGMIPKYDPLRAPVMEIVINGAAIRIPNGTDPALLECTLRILGGDAMLGDISAAYELYIVCGYVCPEQSMSDNALSKLAPCDQEVIANCSDAM